MTWWNWKDQPTAQGKYLCCWGSIDDDRSNVYAVHYYDGTTWRIPNTQLRPNYYTQITSPQEENMLRELHEMI